MNVVSNSVVHLTMRFGSTVLSIGTGFLYQRGEQFFIITAWHNVTGLHPETLRHLSETLGVPDNIIVSLAVDHREHGTYRPSIVLPLADEEKALFYIHPKNWPKIDVVAIPFDPDADHDFEGRTSDGRLRESRVSLLVLGNVEVPGEVCSVQKYLTADRSIGERWLECVGVTEEVFVPGYPHNIQDYYSQPVWKRATIASSVQNGWNNQPKFLVDCASTKGMSGSPVLYCSPSGEVRIQGSTYRFNQAVAILAGIYAGRIGVTKEADPQIGTVWHQSVIDEIIDGRCHERLPAEIEVSAGELEAAARMSLSSSSRQGLENVRNPDLPSRYYVRDRVLEALQGRASLARALDAVLQTAKHYDGPLVPDEDD